MKNQIALISIKSTIIPNSNDKALFFNGRYLISANSDWSQFESIDELALNLAKANNVDVTEITHGVMADGWRWDDIRDELQSSGALAGGLKEYVIDHRFIDAYGDTYPHTASFQAENYDHAIEQLIDEYRTTDSRLLTVNNQNNEDASVLYHTGESDYHLMPQTGSSCWITVGSASVYVKQEGEGVVVDIYPLNGEADASVASTYAHFAECLPETETM